MPIYMEISRLHRTVTIVARGKVAPEEIRGLAQQLLDAHVRGFAKIIEVAGATTDFTREQIDRVAGMLRGAPGEKRGPVAFVVDPERIAFPQAFAEATRGEGPITLFRSLREARDWLERIQYARGEDDQPVDAPIDASAVEPVKGPIGGPVVQPVGGSPKAPPSVPDGTPWSDPDRQGVMIRGERQRDVSIKPLVVGAR